MENNIFRKVSASTPSKEMDVRTAAQKLVESTSELLLSVNQPQHNEAINAFVGRYETDVGTFSTAKIRPNLSRPIIKDSNSNADWNNSPHKGYLR